VINSLAARLLKRPGLIRAPGSGADVEASGVHRRIALRFAWAAVVVITLALIFVGKQEVKWAFKVPREWRLPLRKELSELMEWLVNTADLGFFTFYELTRGLSWLLEQPLNVATGILATGILKGEGSAAVALTPAVPWLAVTLFMMIIGHYAKGWRLSLFVGACFAYLAIFGQWQSAMMTLSSIVIAVPIGVVGGAIFGILAFRSPLFQRIITPLLDLMQTVPVFAYLVPILFLFGFGPVAAMIATIVYAMPPMVRITILALHQVPEELNDLGHMTGCTSMQLLRKVQLPRALPSLMVGVNQVIMLSLNMVIIASMIGAGGLGYDVLAALRRLDIGAGFESGLASVVLAIALERLSQALAVRTREREVSKPHVNAEAKGFLARHPYTCWTIAMLVAVSAAAWTMNWVQRYPDTLTLTTGDFWSDLVRYINVNYFDQIETVKVFILMNVLLPAKRFLLGLPWPMVVCAVALLGYQLGGIRLALLTGALILFCALVGLWDKTMVTVYLCGISVMFAALIGIPLGVLGAEHTRTGRILETIVDTLQTLPSFVYLMPVVMLFRVGDFSAMIAVIAYSLAPAVRYTMHGIRQVDPQLVEVGIASGCTRWQLLAKVKLRLAMPEIMLGINQTVMLALSMLVITALVGTRELGQEVYIALTKADTGRGIVAGLCVAFIAITTDRLIHAGVARSRKRLGLT